MLVTLLCVITVLALVCTATASCFNFHRKKTDLPYTPATVPAKKSPIPKSLSPASKLKKKAPKIFKRNVKPPRRVISRQSSSATTTHPASTTTAQSSDTKQASISRETALSAQAQTEGRKTMRVDKTQLMSSEESLQEDLGDVQLVKPKSRKNIQEILKNCPKLEKKSSDEFISDSTRSFDDTLRGVESLKTDNLTSLAPRSSAEALMKMLKTNTETVK